QPIRGRQLQQSRGDRGHGGPRLSGPAGGRPHHYSHRRGPKSRRKKLAVGHFGRKARLRGCGKPLLTSGPPPCKRRRQRDPVFGRVAMPSASSRRKGISHGSFHRDRTTKGGLDMLSKLKRLFVSSGAKPSSSPGARVCRPALEVLEERQLLAANLFGVGG